MLTFLQTCPQCGTTGAKDAPCPSCGWSDRGDVGVEQDAQNVAVFAQRLRVHRRNYAAYMVLMFAAGLMGLITAYMWLRLIFLGDVIALVVIALATILSGGLTALLFFSKTLLPTNLNCPACNMDLQQLGFEGAHCPGCNAQLR